MARFFLGAAVGAGATSGLLSLVVTGPDGAFGPMFLLNSSARFALIVEFFAVVSAILFSTWIVASGDQPDRAHSAFWGVLAGTIVLVVGVILWALSWEVAVRKPLPGGATLAVQVYTQPSLLLLWGFMTVFMTLAIHAFGWYHDRLPSSPVG